MGYLWGNMLRHFYRVCDQKENFWVSRHTDVWL